MQVNVNFYPNCSER